MWHTPHMTPPATEAQAFGFRLRKFVPEGRVRATARLLDPVDPERGKRNLNRWLAGKVLPSSASRDRLCVALGVTRDELPLPSDADEDEPVAAELAEWLESLSFEELLDAKLKLARIKRRRVA